MATDHASSLMAVRKTAKKSRKQLQSENYRRQKETLFAKLEKMHVQFGANMCLFVERNGKFEIFKHGQMLSILGLNEAMVGCSIRPVRTSLTVLKSKIFPPPRIVTARNVGTSRRKHVDDVKQAV